jgi:hypothetical protein
MRDDYTPTIKAENIQPGMILQFAGTAVAHTEHGDFAIWEAEVDWVEATGDIVLWVTPDGHHESLKVFADPTKHYPIVA